jgi:hypothetical protein
MTRLVAFFNASRTDTIAVSFHFSSWPKLNTVGSNESDSALLTSQVEPVMTNQQVMNLGGTEH